MAAGADQEMTLPIIRIGTIARDQWWHLPALPLLAAIVLLVYGPTLGYGFTYFDDYDLLSLDMRAGGSFRAEVLDAFNSDAFSGQTVFYRPLLIVSLMIDRRIGNGDPRVFHATNLLLHLLTCMTLLLLLRSFGAPRPLAITGSCLFAVHPALVMAVAWIPGRNDLMLALFVLVACLGLVKYLRSYNGCWFCLHVVAVAAAMFTKENGAVALAAYLIISIKSLGLRAAFRRRQLPLYLSWVLLAVCWLLLRDSAVALHRMHMAHLLAPSQTAAGLLGYVGKLFWPAGLRPCPGVAPGDWAVGIVAGTVFAILALIGRIRDRGLFAIGICWYLLFLLPSIAIQHLRELLFLEHRQYLPAVGLLLSATQLGPVQLIDLRRWQTLAIVALLLTALGLRSAVYQRTFINPTVFWKSAVLASPRSAFASAGYARVLLLRGDLRQARDFVLRAIELEPENLNYYYFYHDVESQLSRQDQPAVAVPTPGRWEPGTMSRPAGATASAAPSNLEHVILSYQRYLAGHPRDALAHYRLGLGLMVCQRWDEAAVHYRRALAQGLSGEERAAAFANLSDIYLRWDMVQQSREAQDSARANGAR